MIETILNVPNIMLDIKNNMNDTALDLALVTEKKINFEILLRKYLETRKKNSLNKRGLCYLSLAILVSKLDFIQYMIEDLSFDPNDKGDFEEENPDLHNFPLHQAIISSRADVLKYLLSLSNINANVKDDMKNGDTSLHIAFKLFNAQIISVLLQSKKADLNIKNNNGDNCLIDMIRYYNDNVYPGKRIEFVSILFVMMNQSEFNVNDQGKNGETILHLIRNNKDVLFKILSLKSNLDSNIKDDFGKTAVDHLLDDYSPNYMNILAILTLSNYVINEKLVKSETIFYILKEKPTFQLFKKFINNGLELDAKSKDGIH